MSNIKHINCESDFLLIIRFGKERPDYPWRMVFFTNNTQSPDYYEVGFDGVEYSANCRPVDGTEDCVSVEFNNHRLGRGVLRYKLLERMPDVLFSDGWRDTTLPIALDNVELWAGPSDDVDIPPETEVILARALKGNDGISPEVVVEENSETAYRLRIKAGVEVFETPNLKDARPLLQNTGMRSDAVMSQKAATEAITDVANKTKNAAAAYTNKAIADSATQVVAALSGKVDKELGKGLSEEDFTTLLKQKLEGLSNYDDKTIRVAITAVQNQLDTLLSGDVNGVIDAFNEIEAFLLGITDAQTLTGLLSDLRAEVVALIPRNVSQLTNDAGYVTGGEVDESVAAAVTAEQSRAEGVEAELSERLDGMGDYTPVGGLRFSTNGNTFGENYLLCDGSSVMATDYPKLILDRPFLRPSSTITGARYDVAYGNGICVAIGDYISVSYDGILWTAGGEAPVNGLRQVIYGGGLFVATGWITDDEGVVATSSDGLSWIRRPLEGLRYLYEAVYCGGVYFAAGGDTYAYAFSSDGITWEKRTSPVNYPRILAFGNGVFVMPEGNNGTRVAISTDCATWDIINMPNGQRLGNSIAFGNGKFVLAARDSRVLISDSGTTWTAITLPNRPGHPISHIGFVNGLFVASTDSGYIHTSEDGISWVSVDTNVSSTSGTVHNVLWDGTKYIGIKGQGSQSATLICSVDGKAWNIVQMNAGALSFRGKLVAVGNVLVATLDSSIRYNQTIRIPNFASSISAPAQVFIKVLE